MNTYIQLHHTPSGKTYNFHTLWEEYLEKVAKDNKVSKGAKFKLKSMITEGDDWSAIIKTFKNTPLYPILIKFPRIFRRVWTCTPVVSDQYGWNENDTLVKINHQKTFLNKDA